MFLLKNVETDAYFKKMAGLFFAIFLIQFILGFTIIFRVSAKQTNDFLGRIIEIAQHTIKFENGKWDTSSYDVNPEIPGSYRLYVLNADGYVVDRWRPINGLLDTSDFRQLSSHLQPNTQKSITNHNWRVLSIPVFNSNNKNVGVVAVGKLLSSSDNIGEVDKNLNRVGKSVSKRIQTTADGMNVDSALSELVPYDLSFQVVDQYNKIHLKSDSSNSIDRLPNYIESSYLTDYLKKPRAFRIQDKKTGELFRVISSPLWNQSGEVMGTIIVGKSIQSIKQLLHFYIIGQILIGLPLTIFAFLLFIRWQKQYSIPKKSTNHLLSQKTISSISFIKSECVIAINDHHIPLTYATNQYYLCVALFSAPKKKWELDEIQEKIGDETTWRKTYDAMNSINKKTDNYLQSKLVVTNNKTFQINPQLADRITK